MSQIEPTDRPGASGHRFGPDLACSECGIPWEQHQRNPRPCRTEVAVGVFERRPGVAAEEQHVAPPTAVIPSTPAMPAIDPGKSTDNGPSGHKTNGHRERHD